MEEAEPARMRRGSEIIVEVTDVDAVGDGVALWHGRDVRVPLAVPGDAARVRVLRPGRHPVPSALLAIERPAASRVGPACPHYAEGCGGCAWQDVAYPAQLAAKDRMLRACLGEVSPDRFRPIIPADSPWYYRNKMEFTFGEGPSLGLHRRGCYWDLVDIVDCRLQSPLSNEIRNTVRDCARALGWPPYHKRSHSGELRHLVIRDGKRTGEVLVNLVSRSEALPGVQQVVADLVRRFPAVTSVYWSISPEKGDAIKAHREALLAGEPHIREVLDGLEFHIGPQTFFQANTAQAERLCHVVAGLCSEAGHRDGLVVLDLYCGVGTFALSMAKRFPGARAFGIELSPQSVASARENAARNGLSDVQFLLGDVGQRLPEALRAAGRPDVMIVDPPRAGLAPGIVGALAALAAPQILYVSCNPVALGRDLTVLRAAGYAAAAVQPVDMFPHTRHLETVVSLRYGVAGPGRAAMTRRPEGSEVQDGAPYAGNPSTGQGRGSEHGCNPMFQVGAHAGSATGHGQLQPGCRRGA